MNGFAVLLIVISYTLSGHMGHLCAFSSNFFKEIASNYMYQNAISKIHPNNRDPQDKIVVYGTSFTINITMATQSTLIRPKLCKRSFKYQNEVVWSICQLKG